MTINCKGELIDFSTPKVMGVLNITPDSFYDGGRYTNDKELLNQTEKMLTEGATFIDNRYKINFKEAKQAGFRVGSYHYFSTTSSPEQQFKNFMRQVDPRAQDIIPMIDLEENKNWSKEEYVSNLKIFLHLIEEQFKSKPLLYSVQGFYNTYIRNDFNSYHWNIARYNIKKPHLLDKNRWSLWQFSDKERIKGIKKYVDLNLIRNNLKIDIIMLNN